MSRPSLLDPRNLSGTDTLHVEGQALGGVGGVVGGVEGGTGVPGQLLPTFGRVRLIIG
jgi:hypothetical protein